MKILRTKYFSDNNEEEENKKKKKLRRAALGLGGTALALNAHDFLYDKNSDVYTNVEKSLIKKAKDSGINVFRSKTDVIGGEDYIDKLPDYVKKDLSKNGAPSRKTVDFLKQHGLNSDEDREHLIDNLDAPVLRISDSVSSHEKLARDLSKHETEKVLKKLNSKGYKNSLLGGAIASNLGGGIHEGYTGKEDKLGRATGLGLILAKGLPEIIQEAKISKSANKKLKDLRVEDINKGRLIRPVVSKILGTGASIVGGEIVHKTGEKIGKKIKEYHDNKKKKENNKE